VAEVATEAGLELTDLTVDADRWFAELRPIGRR
jgi:hypothetical protein